jgi:hypothetical protein
MSGKWISIERPPCARAFAVSVASASSARVDIQPPQQGQSGGPLGWAAALAAREALALRLHGIDQLGLPGRSGGESGIERAGMAEATTGHLGDLCVVAGVERGETAAPAQCLGVVNVAFLAFCQDRPDRVELAVLAQQMPVAQAGGFEIPDAHSSRGRWRAALAVPPSSADRSIPG